MQPEAQGKVRSWWGYTYTWVDDRGMIGECRNIYQRWEVGQELHPVRVDGQPTGGTLTIQSRERSLPPHPAPMRTADARTAGR